MSNLIFWALTIFYLLNQHFLMFVFAVIFMPVVLDFLSNFLVLPFFSHMFLDCSLISFLAFSFTTCWLDFDFHLLWIPVYRSSFFAHVLV